jgi:hypothetical protein
MGKSKPKAPVTPRAIVQRVNRKLAAEFEAVRRWRVSGSSGPWTWEPGNYYRVDYKRNALLDGNVDLELLARELGVLKPWESMASEK